jgi:hypothetical protein
MVTCHELNLGADPPSRNDNPFATCWTKPGALSFHFQNGQSATGLIARLASRNWIAEITGPHGSGKSTLLATLKPALLAAGCRIYAIALRDSQRRLSSVQWDFVFDQVARAQPTTQIGSAKLNPSHLEPSLLVIDGFEQLGLLQRARLRTRCRRQRVGLLVTSHAPTGLPTLMHLAPDRCLVERLVAQLCADASTDVTNADVAASYACHGSNVREIFFDLYDRHEHRRRQSRTRRLADA